MNNSTHPDSLHNVNIKGISPLSTPNALKKLFPLNTEQVQTVKDSRETIKAILGKSDKRLLLVVGPCSIHDPESAWEYAVKLNDLRLKLKDKCVIVMRVYFEKPRTTIGWKGLINDPRLDDSFDMELGLKIARRLLLKITSLGMPLATEMLDPVAPQYISDLISWAAIGARTTESQTHREMTSGLSMPVGFKNATSGNMQIALDAINSAKNPHSFIGIDQDGQTSLVQTNGNPHCHVVLRGGSEPNYDATHINSFIEAHKKAKLSPALMIDCSHGNSKKQPEKQKEVLLDVLQQRNSGTQEIIGLMIESHLKFGNQSFNTLDQLDYGLSITDACLDWPETETLLEQLHRDLK